MFPLSFVGKAVLTLSHGNAAPESFFSVNNALLANKGKKHCVKNGERSHPHFSSMKN